MAWFPLMIDLEGADCLVAGGGRIALHKAQTLLSFGAQVTVVAREALPEFSALPVRLQQREVLEEDLSGMLLAVDATGDPQVGEMLARACRERRIPLNVVDSPALCSYIFPAMLRRGPLLAAVSTGGASPIAAAWARDRLGAALPDGFEELVGQMTVLRPRMQREIADPAVRSALAKRCFLAAVEKGAVLTDEEIERLWRDTE